MNVDSLDSGFSNIRLDPLWHFACIICPKEAGGMGLWGKSILITFLIIFPNISKAELDLGSSKADGLYIRGRLRDLPADQNLKIGIGKGHELQVGSVKDRKGIVDEFPKGEKKRYGVAVLNHEKETKTKYQACRAHKGIPASVAGISVTDQLLSCIQALTKDEALKDLHRHVSNLENADGPLEKQLIVMFGASWKEKNARKNRLDDCESMVEQFTTQVRPNVDPAVRIKQELTYARRIASALMMIEVLKKAEKNRLGEMNGWLAQIEALKRDGVVLVRATDHLVNTTHIERETPDQKRYRELFSEIITSNKNNRSYEGVAERISADLRTLVGGALDFRERVAGELGPIPPGIGDIESIFSRGLEHVDQLFMVGGVSCHRLFELHRSSASTTNTPFRCNLIYGCDSIR